MAWEKNGFKIDVNNDGRFYLNYEGTVEDFPSLKDATDRAAELARESRTTLDLACVMGDGAPVTLKKVHMGNGTFITNPPKQVGGYHYNSGRIYVDTPMVRDLVQAHILAEKHLKSLTERLDRFRIGGRSGKQRGEVETQVRKEWEEKHTRALAEASAETVTP